jgi:hypothetical protein
MVPNVLNVLNGLNGLNVLNPIHQRLTLRPTPFQL